MAAVAMEPERAPDAVETSSGSSEDAASKPTEAANGRRRSARCINRQRPKYMDEIMMDEPARRRRNVKKKAEEEKPEPAAENGKKRGRPSKKAKLDPLDGEKMPILAIEPISCAGIAANGHGNGSTEAAEVDGEGIKKSWKVRVKETLRAFNTHYLHFVQEEQKRVTDAAEAKGPKPKKTSEKGKKQTSEKGKKRASKKGKKETGNNEEEEKRISKRPDLKAGHEQSDEEEEEKRLSKRPDLKAITEMQKTKTVLYDDKRIGHLPGIDIGDQFYSRAEMVVLGLHSHWLNGIDYMGMKYKKQKGYENYIFPLATCIVLSGMYEDDLDKSDEIIYTGQGGHDLLGNKLQIADQKLERGNLALKNSSEVGNPIRVIRGHDSKNSYCGKVYTYDGLYKVINYWPDKGHRGFIVYKFKLKRLEGQASLTTSQVRFAREQVPNSISELRGLVCEDISGGQEKFPIPATNVVDDPPVAPSGFVYSKSLQIPNDLHIPVSIEGCNCIGDCGQSKNCSCSRRNGSELPYVLHKDVGRLIEAKSIVFECGANCNCNNSCINRTSQQGLKYRMEVFRTAQKGWGVRAWETIPAGAPICEYTGKLRRTEEMDGLLENNYIFDVDCLQTMKGLDGREKRPGDVPILSGSCSDAPEYCIDAGHVGNIARFINHSCQPNLFVQCILSSHNDFKLAKVMLFAADNIPPLQELTYDYGYRMDSVVGPDGNVVKMPCYCGAADCRKRLY